LRNSDERPGQDGQQMPLKMRKKGNLAWKRPRITSFEKKKTFEMQNSNGKKKASPSCKYQ
jgi:hypothetical protein